MDAALPKESPTNDAEKKFKATTSDVSFPGRLVLDDDLATLTNPRSLTSPDGPRSRELSSQTSQAFEGSRQPSLFGSEGTDSPGHTPKNRGGSRSKASLRSRQSFSASKAAFTFQSTSDQSRDSLEKKDYSNLLSAKVEASTTSATFLEDRPSNDGRHHLQLEPSYPLPLIVFVVWLSIVAGLVVTGVHFAIVYAGCPLGLNGCNSFIEEKESKGFFFIKWFKRVTDDQIPEDFVYITSSILGATLLAVVFHYIPEGLAFQIKGGGTIQSLVAVACGERITLTTAAMRLLASAIYLGSGGTLGLDGPAIQVCCAATTFLGYAVGMRSVPTQALLACLGFAGGFAATFNSPLAGILFAMEELQHVSSRLSKHIICVILMCSIVSTAVARACQGNQQLLQANWEDGLFDSVGGGSLDKVFGFRMWMLVAIPIGIFCSFVGFACSRSIRFLFDVLWTLRQRVPTHEPVTFVISAALVACIGSLVFRTTGLRVVWGIGYESLQKSFDRDFQASDYLIVAFGKLSAMVLAVVTKAPGDILEPVLISGAFLGGSVGNVLQILIEDDELAEQVLRPCLVFGMVGLFASCFRFPLTPVVIVLELMGVETYSLVLPAALAGFTAIITSNRLFPPLLDELMHEDGVDCHELSQEADALEEMELKQGDEAEAEQEPEPEQSQDVPKMQAWRRSSGELSIASDDLGNAGVEHRSKSPVDREMARSPSGTSSSNNSAAAGLPVTNILSRSSGISRATRTSAMSHTNTTNTNKVTLPSAPGSRRVSIAQSLMQQIEISALELSKGLGSQVHIRANGSQGRPQSVHDPMRRQESPIRQQESPPSHSKRQSKSSSSRASSAKRVSSSGLPHGSRDRDHSVFGKTMEQCKSLPRNFGRLQDLNFMDRLASSNSGEHDNSLAARRNISLNAIVPSSKSSSTPKRPHQPSDELEVPGMTPEEVSSRDSQGRRLSARSGMSLPSVPDSLDTTMPPVHEHLGSSESTLN